MKAPSFDKMNMSAINEGTTSPLCTGAASTGQYSIDKDWEQVGAWDSCVDKVLPRTWQHSHEMLDTCENSICGWTRHFTSDEITRLQEDKKYVFSWQDYGPIFILLMLISPAIRLIWLASVLSYMLTCQLHQCQTVLGTLLWVQSLSFRAWVTVFWLGQAFGDAVEIALT